MDINVEVLKIMSADPLRAGGIELTFHMPNSSKDIAQNELKNTGDTRRIMKSVHPDIEVKGNRGR
jgi:hypothetical protein